MPEKHARLSPSSAHRWLNCTPSARLAEQFPDTRSEYAAAGTLAHSIAELKARKHFIEPMGARTFNSRMKKLKSDPLYDPSMDSATDTYLDHLKELSLTFKAPPFVALESRVDYGHLVPGGFGRTDCIMVGEGWLYVVDYKNGAGVPVEAEENPQMMLYALGALHTYAPIYGDTLRSIRMTIVQPNAGGIKDWSMARDELDRWGKEYVRPRAELADSGAGEFVPGDWCRFCPAKAQCTARAKKMLELEPMKGAVPAGGISTDQPATGPLLSDSEIGDVLNRAVGLSDWVQSLKDYALTSILDGREIPGWKAVEGRGTRDWMNLDAAFGALQDRGIPESLLWERKPATVAGLEKALGKKSFAGAAEGLWTKSPGKPTLVPENDRRPPYVPAEAAFKGVGSNG